MYSLIHQGYAASGGKLDPKEIEAGAFDEQRWLDGYPVIVLGLL
jgi:hypothetical protein